MRVVRTFCRPEAAIVEGKRAGNGHVPFFAGFLTSDKTVVASFFTTWRVSRCSSRTGPFVIHSCHQISKWLHPSIHTYARRHFELPGIPKGHCAAKLDSSVPDRGPGYLAGVISDEADDIFCCRRLVFTLVHAQSDGGVLRGERESVSVTGTTGHARSVYAADRVFHFIGAQFSGDAEGKKSPQPKPQLPKLILIASSSSERRSDSRKCLPEYPSRPCVLSMSLTHISSNTHSSAHRIRPPFPQDYILTATHRSRPWINGSISDFLTKKGMTIKRSVPSSHRLPLKTRRGCFTS
jgi:hypothetical protein